MLINSLAASPADMDPPLGASGHDLDHATTTREVRAMEDPFEDVFESDQPPRTATSALDDQTSSSSNTDHPPSAAAAAAAASRSGFSTNEVSDVPRLQAIHSTAGYRDGVSTAKEKFLQEGFDEGFALGAELGRIVGHLLGAVEAAHAALEKAGRISAAVDDAQDGRAAAVAAAAAASSDGSLSRIVDAGLLARVADLLEKAREELSLAHVFGQAHFDRDGIWTYAVENDAAPSSSASPENEDETVTFARVARAHPIVLEWTRHLDALAAELGMDLDRVRSIDAASD
jgi:hypothetical protein